MYIQVSCAARRWTNVGRAWVTERKGCIIGRHLECDYLHPPSISIPLYSRGSELRCYGGNGFLPRRAPIRDPQLTFTRHRRPVFHLAPICESTIFRARFRHACDDRIPRPRLHAHTMIDRRCTDRARSDISNSSFPSGNYRARYGDAVALSWELFFSKMHFLRPKENHVFEKRDRVSITKRLPVDNDGYPSISAKSYLIILFLLFVIATSICYL